MRRADPTSGTIQSRAHYLHWCKIVLSIRIQQEQTGIKKEASS
ncbi:MAG: hypothetical protein RLZZ543_2313 [Bacteroidota bacterium]